MEKGRLKRKRARGKLGRIGDVTVESQRGGERRWRRVEREEREGGGESKGRSESVAESRRGGERTWTGRVVPHGLANVVAASAVSIAAFKVKGEVGGEANEGRGWRRDDRKQSVCAPRLAGSIPNGGIIERVGQSDQPLTGCKVKPNNITG